MEITRRKYLKIQIFAGLAVIAAAIIYFFPPGEASFYPRCFVHSLTGLNCLGCGSLRATHQLLHGNFLAAFELNPGVILGLPLLGFLGLCWMLRIKSKS